MPLLKKLLSCLVAAALAFTCVWTATLPASASYQSQIAELEQKQAALKSKIAALQDDIDEQAALKEALQEQIDVVQKQIDLYNGQIAELEEKIEQMEAERQAKEDELNAKKQTFLARLRAMYIAGGDTKLAILMGADDFADYLYQNELLASVTKYDNKVMDQLREDIAEIERLKAQVQKEQANIEKLKATVDKKRSELNESMKSLNAVIAKLQGQQNELQGDIETYQKAIDALEKKIAEEAERARQQSIQQSIQYSGEQFGWPTPGFYWISSPYGYRWGRLHKGVDIAGGGIYGTPIHATADGVVSLVDYNAGGYGYYVMINHGMFDGNNYTTLYAHMPSWAPVAVGQTVHKGDVIGYVGSTGRSTGPHCHYEIRVNGVAQNPMNFYSSIG